MIEQASLVGPMYAAPPVNTAPAPDPSGAIVIGLGVAVIGTMGLIAFAATRRKKRARR